MEQIVYALKLDMRDTGIVNTSLRLKQGDSGMKIEVNVFNGGTPAFDPLTTPKIVFRRPDGAAIMADMTVGVSSYNYTLVGNELQVPGKELIDVKFPIDSDGRESTMSCSIDVVPDTITPNTHGSGIYDNDLAQILTEVEADVDAAEDSAEDAEAWAVGERGGVPVDPTDPTYHNNAKYYAKEADPTTLSSLTDTNISSPTDGQILKYDAASEKWINGAGEGSVSELNDLDDVNISSATNGQVLTFDGTGWKNEDIPTPTVPDELNDLDDVAISSASNGQALLYDSTTHKWKNGDVAGSAADITYDNTGSGLTATDVQEAIDEIDSNLDTLDGKVYKTDDSTETTIASDDKIPFYDVSATSRKNITVANIVSGAVSNPNLLDNPWFTVNQRGQSSYTSVTSALTYNFDRWATWAGASGSITVASASQGVNVTVTSDAEDNQLTQRMDIDLTGKIITLSLDVNGIIYTVTGEVPARTSSWQSITIDTGTGVRCNFNVAPIGESISCATTIRCGKNNTTYNIRAIKLEVGSVSTLAMDTAPNYATELLKCQRYFQTTGKSGFNGVGVGQARSATIASIHFNPFVKFRTTPVLSVDFSHLYLRNAENSIHPTSVSVDTAADSSSIMLAFVGTGFTAGAVYEALMETGYEMTFSADL